MGDLAKDGWVRQPGYFEGGFRAMAARAERRNRQRKLVREREKQGRVRYWWQTPSDQGQPPQR